uniref:Uncharacterized protein n=1 Tax=Ixodes ricinus TaxID=34613 RepID=A0A6B0U2Q4_IXORI
MCCCHLSPFKSFFFFIFLFFFSGLIRLFWFDYPLHLFSQYEVCSDFMVIVRYLLAKYRFKVKSGFSLLNWRCMVHIFGDYASFPPDLE